MTRTPVPQTRTMSARPALARAALLLAACAALPGARAQSPAPALANPASRYCVDQGGRLAFDKDGAGGQYGLCLFQDNRQCEAWALLRGHCPAGGLAMAGYVTPAARYCVLRGGRYQVLSAGQSAAEQGSCAFANGKSCAAGAFFDGLCTPAAAGDTLHALFRCDAGKTVDAVFSNGTRSSVSLVLSDGRALSLPQAPSASGARYASADDSLVFWNKGDTGLVAENGKVSYSGCSTRP